MTVLIEINRYLRRTGLSATQFGRRATNDPRLVHDLRHGRQPRAETVHRIEAFMTGHPDPLAEPSHAGGRGR